MNRQQRRAAGQVGKVKTYILTDEQIKHIKEEAANGATDKAFIAMPGLPILTLHDEFEFESEKLEKFMDRLLFKYECFKDGYVSLEEIKQIIKDETGVEIYGNV